MCQFWVSIPLRGGTVPDDSTLTATLHGKTSNSWAQSESNLWQEQPSSLVLYACLTLLTHCPRKSYTCVGFHAPRVQPPQIARQRLPAPRSLEGLSQTALPHSLMFQLSMENVHDANLALQQSPSRVRCMLTRVVLVRGAS